MSELFQINKCADANLLDLVHDEKPIVVTDVVIELQNKSYNDKVITETFNLRIPRTRGLLTSTNGIELRLNLDRLRLAFNKTMKPCHGTDSVILSELNDNQILRVDIHLLVVIKPKEVSNNVIVTGWCDRPELADSDTGCKICDNLCVNATLQSVVIGNADVPREKEKKMTKTKKKPQLFMQEVDRSAYDPKTGKVKSLPNGPKIPLVFGTPKKPLKNLFEKMIGFKLNGNEHRACLSILDRAMNHQRINPQEICLNESDEESFLHGCYGIVTSLLEEKKLISREFTTHYPAITDKGMKALKFLKGFCDDKCCSGC